MICSVSRSLVGLIKRTLGLYLLLLSRKFTFSCDSKITLAWLAQRRRESYRLWT